MQSSVRQQPKRIALPAEFPRTLIHHEPENTQCQCGCALKRIGEDVSEKLDYTPGVFSVERHVRGKWVCDECETLTQAPVPAQVIDKGIPTAGLLAQGIVAKYADHYIAASCEVEREVCDLEPDVRRRIRQEKAAPLMDAFHTWMTAQREQSKIRFLT
ncbi:Transposase [Pseudomonas syringae pv. maculicola]|nr:Transposase [Pseudomonas syringae pv. maculicola]